MIAVHNFNVHARVSHESSYLSQLTRLVLIQTLNQHFAVIQDFD